MKKRHLAILVSLMALGGGAMAQTSAPSPSSEIRMSTDPDRVAEIERHAEELRARQQQMDMQSGSSGSSGMESNKPKSHKATKKMKHSSKKPKTTDSTSGMSQSQPASDSGAPAAGK